MGRILSICSLVVVFFAGNPGPREPTSIPTGCIATVSRRNPSSPDPRSTGYPSHSCKSVRRRTGTRSIRVTSIVSRSLRYVPYNDLRLLEAGLPSALITPPHAEHVKADFNFGPVPCTGVRNGGLRLRIPEFLGRWSSHTPDLQSACDYCRQRQGRLVGALVQDPPAY